MQFIFEIPDDKVEALIDGVCLATCFKPADPANIAPQEKRDWVKARSVDWFKNRAKAGALMKAQADAKAAIDPIQIT